MQQLKEILHKIDGKGYKAYKDIKGNYRFPNYRLIIDAVQGDPFASPSKIRVLIPLEKTRVSKEWLNHKWRKIMCEDVLLRSVSAAIDRTPSKVNGSGKSGLLAIDRPGQEILERTAVQLNELEVTLCMTIGLPAQGRRVLGKQAERLFIEILPSIIERSVLSVTKESLVTHVQLIDQQQAIRNFMKDNNLISFIANGSLLPRESGISDRPLKKTSVIPFRSPKSLEVEIPIPHRDAPIKGMGINKGVTLIVGGGFHGKSTLLKAMERGVYHHIQGDGREFVLSDPTAVKIRAEDGRSVIKTNISAFINHLPYHQDTETFTSDNASGSTSQAANIIEALEVGAKTLLMDEDTCATNFMIRDARMQALVHKEHEPITPYLDKIRPLFQDYQVSTILVMGGAGDYFDVADCVIKMENYQAYEVTEEAKRIAHDIQYHRVHEGGQSFGALSSRKLIPKGLNSRNGKKSAVKARSLSTIQWGTSHLDLSYVEQLVDPSQTRMITEILTTLAKTELAREMLPISERLDQIEKQMDEQGLASFSSFKENPGALTRPRKYEIAAALNRLRQLQVD
ncbi:putative ABC-class ATPase [Pullulanibacillus pueri]|uniref:ATPase n=1 Tax=Pullulanibacillus pueri TaxID=1437324 RepID=A0A8J3EKY7_9BACL|nr:ABC-ATPase domain-containing protein [Pullulanibacillus pueri]MBM7681091.1 putative ABC-class ATPase [Pullulanibacillus pueri]GGH77013.1 ATPase [Pullulanibacillus pueri]